MLRGNSVESHTSTLTTIFWHGVAEGAENEDGMISDYKMSAPESGERRGPAEQVVLI